MTRASEERKKKDIQTKAKETRIRDEKNRKEERGKKQENDRATDSKLIELVAGQIRTSSAPVSKAKRATAVKRECS